MYVRDAKNRDEVWLLDRIEEMALDDVAFRSRDYVIAVDEETDVRAGFGRIRLHATGGTEGICELTSIGVLDGWRGQGVGAHVVERLVDGARAEGFDRVYALTSTHEYLAQFGFEAVAPEELPEQLGDRLEEKRESLDPDAVPMVIETDAFEMPERLREGFKRATEDEDGTESEPQESPEDFGIDPDEATYKYDTGR
jgi:N-acetylglutamate synthase-like GNAT family acetyltransferase